MRALLVKVDEIIVALRRVAGIDDYIVLGSSFWAALVIVFKAVQLRLWSVLLVDEVLRLTMVILGLLFTL